MLNMSLIGRISEKRSKNSLIFSQYQELEIKSRNYGTNNQGTMSKKTTEHAASVLKEIKAEINPDVIKEYEMPTLCNMETARETGFAVILTLSTKFNYTSAVLDDWRKRLEADDYIISVKRNQLRVRFNVMYEKK